MVEPNSTVVCDSNDYRHTFYGILNKQGQFWTPLPFHDEASAEAHLRTWAKGKYASMLDTHKIVPVRIRLELLPTPDSGNPGPLTNQDGGEKL